MPQDLNLTIGDYLSSPRRLATFKGKWPHKSPSAQQVSDAGFFYRGDQDAADNVMCPSCELCIYDWDPKDDPFEEHHKQAPNCHYAERLKELYERGESESTVNAPDGVGGASKKGGKGNAQKSKRRRGKSGSATVTSKGRNKNKKTTKMTGNGVTRLVAARGIRQSNGRVSPALSTSTLSSLANLVDQIDGVSAHRELSTDWA